MPMQSNPQFDFWERRAAAWDRRADAVNGLSEEYGRLAMERLGVQARERVVDIGCGPGTTTVQLAQSVGPEGLVLALDISPAMVAAAVRRAEAARLTNVQAVVHDLEEGPVGTALDGAYSRFGVMFFTDPATAFSNLAKSLRPGGRLGCCVWADVGQNPWMFVPTLASAEILGADLALPGPGQPGPFSLADGPSFRELLEATGFVDVDITTVSGGRVLHDSSSDEEIRALLEMGPVAEAYEAADDGTRDSAVEAVRAAIAPFQEGDGWRLPGAALVVTAHIPAS